MSEVGRLPGAGGPGRTRTDAETDRLAARPWSSRSGGGINGLAASERRVRVDPRLPQRRAHPAATPRTGEVAIRMGLGLHGRGAPAGATREIIGTLAISYAASRGTSPSQRPGAAPGARGPGRHRGRQLAAVRRSCASPRSATTTCCATRRTSCGQTDRDGRFTFLSDVFERLSGGPPSEVLGRPFAMLVHPDSGRPSTALRHTPPRVQPFPPGACASTCAAGTGMPVPVELRAVADVVDGSLRRRPRHHPRPARPGPPRG